MNTVYSKNWQCYGCGLCAQKCPRRAIQMVSDDNGFYYPKIDETLCVNCGLCKKICTYYHDNSRDIVSAYIAKYNNKDVLRQSTSGGMFSALADWIIQNGGVIYGAGFDENMKVTLKRATDESDYTKFRGSKYVQCDMTNIFQLLNRDLEDGKYVLFTGTPCMVSAIQLSLKPQLQEKLVTCDLICNGTSSPLLWSLFVKELEKKYKSKLTYYRFRTKTNDSYLSKDEIATFQNGKIITLVDATQKYNTSVYYANLGIRPSCNHCKFTSKKRVGDFTIGDCIHILNEFPQFDPYLGASTLLVNSEKGKSVLKSLGTSINLYQIPIEKAISLRMTTPIEENNQTQDFINNAKKYGLKKAVRHQLGFLTFYKVRIYNQIKKPLRKRTGDRSEFVEKNIV